MKKILVPIDFSDTSENAFIYALEMAKSYKAQLILLHTFDLPFVDNQVVAFNYAEIYDTLEVTNSNQFEDEMSKLTAVAKTYLRRKGDTANLVALSAISQSYHQNERSQSYLLDVATGTCRL